MNFSFWVDFHKTIPIKKAYRSQNFYYDLYNFVLHYKFLKDLANFSLGEFKSVFHGNLPMIDGRYKNLVLVKNELDNEKMIDNLFDKYLFDAVRLLNFLTSFSSVYSNISTYKGVYIYFHKWAQLTVSMFNTMSKKFYNRSLKNIDKLTAFADYRLPQNIASFLKF